MLRDLSTARAGSCGRCGAEIPEGFFCESCHSFFSRLARAQDWKATRLHKAGGLGPGFRGTSHAGTVAKVWR